MWTWISPDGKTKNEIDFIMTNRNSYFTNFTVIRRFNFNTNHRLIRTELQINEPKKARPRQDLGNTKLNEQQLEQITTALRTELGDFKEKTKELETQDKYNYIENAIKTQIKLIADTKIDAKGILSTATLNLLEERNHLINERNIQNRRQKLAKSSKDVKESMRKDRKQRRMRTIENYILKTGGIKKALKELTDTKNWIVKMKDNRGKFNHNRIDILKTATSYYKNLYRNNTTQAEINLVDTLNTPSILKAEVSKAIDTQKREKAPGPDGIRKVKEKEADHRKGGTTTLDEWRESHGTEWLKKERNGKGWRRPLPTGKQI
ncbi:uncharacterized protein LOC126370781 [Pectinophora gossypiella]|uniref:uncharacterized protein LOC126370781 n=1 Tax=Pectinophora gossypiella TaxID=13191 RepID=UPI00214E2540|nr:uncharacterized protein LOC126370781 [Pectinophora gossypiella]